MDIFESAWFGDYTKSVVHIDGYGADKRASTKQYDTPGLHSGYHHFGLEWTPNSMKIYYNGVHKVTYTGIWVPQVAEWLWLSTGASFGDIGTFASEPIGWLTSAKVDYVRVWQYDWNRADASDQVTVSLFVTADNTITGTRTDLLVDASGLRQVNDAYEAVSREEAYTAVAADAGKTLFAAIETTSGGFARIDNFSLTVNRSATFAEWIAGYGLEPDQQRLSDDPDGDGIPNGLELWFGTHPGEASSAVDTLAWQGLNFSFSHPMSETPPSDLVGTYEWSPNLVDWYAGDGVDGPAGGATVLFEATTDGQSVQVNATASSAMERFFARIVVSSE